LNELTPLDDLYVQFAELFGSINDAEHNLTNQRRDLARIKEKIVSNESDGGYGVEFTAHAFKQISERLESLALDNPVIYDDIFNITDPQHSLIIPSNLKSFIISVIAAARKSGLFTKERSRQGGTEFHYRIKMEKWSSDRELEFVGIVENGNIKTGFFNWR
jgi:hypothetical protein